VKVFQTLLPPLQPLPVCQTLIRDWSSVVC